MTRILAAIAALLLAPAVQAQIARKPAAPPPAAAIAKVDDGYLLGSPSAPIRVVVVSSYGCIHCAHFETDAMARLKRDWIATGRARVRFVPFLMFPTDVPALILSECGPISDFARRSAALFRRRDATEASFRSADRATLERLKTATVADQTMGIARLSGLSGGLPTAGVTVAIARACLVDPQLRDALRTRQTLADRRYHPTGTPTVLVDGRTVTASWSTIETALNAKH